MRDDIHKRAPGGRAWRSVVKAAARDADWEVGTTPKIERALRAELLKEHGADFLRSLAARYGLFDVHRAGLQFASPFQIALESQLEAGRSNIITDATAALHQVAEAWLRETAGRLASDNPGGAKLVIQRIHKAYKTIRLQTLVETELSHETSRPKQARPQFDPHKSINETLSSPR